MVDSVLPYFDPSVQLAGVQYEYNHIKKTVYGTSKIRNIQYIEPGPTVYTTTLPTTVQYRLDAQCTVYNIQCTVYTTTLPTTVQYRLGAQCTVYWFKSQFI